MKNREGSRWKLLKVGVAVLIGLVTMALFFPTGGVSGCPGGGDGDCEDYATSILVRYPGENDAIGIGIAVGAGTAAGVLVYFVLAWLGRRRSR